MAGPNKLGPGPRILGLLVLILGFLISGSLWFDYLGIIDVSSIYAPVFRLVGIQGRDSGVPADDPVLLDSVRLSKEREAVNLLEDELEARQAELANQEQELQSLRAELEEREDVLEERENSFNQRVRQYDNRRENLIRNSQDLTNMRLENAVEILLSYDDQLLIETLRITEQLAQEAGEMSLVSVWLSEFPPERAADIQRKMTIRPEG
ncbi:MAG: periplasmic-type flagellar collar protein FlbB [Spirochaeta sp.]